MGAPSKRASKVRSSDDFDSTLLRSSIVIPKGSGVSLTSWTLAEIFAARDAQMRGDFRLPARMAESMRTDDAILVARENRLAPIRCVKVKMSPAKGAQGKKIAGEADALFGQEGVGVTSDTISSVLSCLIDHDIAFGLCTPTPRADGSRVDVVLNAWPIEHVRWDMNDRVFKTRVDTSTLVPGATVGGEIPIVHGDGRWVIFQRYEIDPFKHGTLLAAAIVWARHAYGIRDWSKGSVAHGSAKVIGTMPKGVALQDTATGGLTSEASAMVDLLRAFATGDSPVGIKPSESQLEFITNNSTAWQVWKELVDNAERAAARLYLGTDGTLGTNGGAPGVDIQSLFGVAATKVEGDLQCIQRGIDTGVIEPWCAMNFGDSSLAPKRRYMVPDGDAEALKKSLGERTAAFSAAIKGRRDAGIALTQEDVDGLAADFGVRAPKVPAAASDTTAAASAAKK